MGFFEDVVCIRPKAHGLSGNGELPPQFDAATTTHDHHGSDEGEGQDSMAVNESDGSSGARHHGMEDHCAEATGHTARRGQDGSNTNVSGANKENCLPGQELAEIRLAQEAMDGFQRVWRGRNFVRPTYRASPSVSEQGKREEDCLPGQEQAEIRLAQENMDGFQRVRRGRNFVRPTYRASPSVSEQGKREEELFLGRIHELSQENHDLRRNMNHMAQEMAKMRNNNANTSGHWQLVCTQLIRPYLYERDTQFTSSDRDLNTILERINQDLTDLGSLKERFQTLQQEMLSNVDRTNPIPDTQFEQDFRSLTAAIKTVSRTVPPQSLDRICTDFDNFTLTRHVRKSYWSSRGRRRCFVEAAIWSILVDCVFQSPFGILGDRCTIFTNIWKQLFGLSHGLSWPHPSVACETWRWNTMEQLVSGAGRKTITLGDEDMESAETKGNTDLQNSVQQARLKVYLRIEGILKPLDPDFDTSRLWPIVNQAFTLALDMFTQRCRLQTMAPDPDDLYIAGVSDHLESLQESEDVKFGRVAFTVNPGLSKWGDAHGKKLDERLFIVPSLVLLEEYMPKGP